MKHYVLLLKESEVSIGTYISVHFYKDAPFEDIPVLPDFNSKTKFGSLISSLENEKWKRIDDPLFMFSLQEFIINDFRLCTTFYYNTKDLMVKIKEFQLLSITEGLNG